MASIFLVTVCGLLLAASGLASPITTPSSIEEIPDGDLFGLLNNRSIAAYQLIIKNRRDENIVLSALGTVSLLYELYRINDQPGLRNEWLETFFGPFITSTEMIQAVDFAVGIPATSWAGLSGSLNLGSTTAYRPDCKLFGCESSMLRNESLGEDGLVFSTIGHGVKVIDKWYKTLQIETKFDESEFHRGECAILLDGTYFRQHWRPSDACFLRTKFFESEDSFQDNVKYTRTIRVLPGYGKLPELDAQYIEIPWGKSKLLDEHTELFLYVILPNTLDGLHELEIKITNHTIDKMLREARRGPVDVSLPEISLTQKYQLTSIIGDVWTTPAALCSGSDVHPRFVAAATVAKFDGFQAPPTGCPLSMLCDKVSNSDIPSFNANHPFLAILGSKDVDSGMFTIHQLVRYRKPEQGQN